MAREPERHDESAFGTVSLELLSGQRFAARVVLHGEHDLATAPSVRETIRGVAGNVLVDLSDCAFIDSTIISVILAGDHDLKQDGYRVELVAPPSQYAVSRVLDVIGLRNIITTHSSLPQ